MTGLRYQLVDVARGVGFGAMFAYHAAWFATDRGLVDLPIGTDLAWRAFQRSIAGSFFLLVGVSLVLANRERVRPGPFAWRLAKLCGGALIVTVASAVLNPRMLVTYGILHSIAVNSVLGVGLLALARGQGTAGRIGLAAFGVAAIAVSWVHLPAFDGWLGFTGLGTVHRATFDFQPMFPWLGVVALGLAAGLGIRRDGAVARWGSGAAPVRGLALLGRHALFLYLAHVPVLVVTVEAVAWWLGR
ncbi:MAG: heparan-alpha-glucosaminide N-acetyltransferase [Myxococcota bacterium]